MYGSLIELCKNLRTFTDCLFVKCDKRPLNLTLLCEEIFLAKNCHGQFEMIGAVLLACSVLNVGYACCPCCAN